jgi:hypothetical protein
VPNDQLNLFNQDISRLLKSSRLAMLNEQLVLEFRKLCADARNSAEKGDFEEAHRLLKFARDFLVEESDRHGIKGD